MPENGLFLKKTTVNITASDTVYSILQKVCKAKNIALEQSIVRCFRQSIFGASDIYMKRKPAI